MPPSMLKQIADFYRATGQDELAQAQERSIETTKGFHAIARLDFLDKEFHFYYRENVLTADVFNKLDGMVRRELVSTIAETNICVSGYPFAVLPFVDRELALKELSTMKVAKYENDFLYLIQ